MKKLMTMAAILALSAGAAYAQGASQDIQINADVDAYCTIEGSEGLTTSIPTSNGDVVDSDIPVNIGDVVCNAASDVQLTSENGGLFSATDAPDGFQNYINYVASVADPTAASVTADATTPTEIDGAVATTTGATSDTGVIVTINPTPNGEPLVAATDYTDTLTVSITPDV